MNNETQIRTTYGRLQVIATMINDNRTNVSDDISSRISSFGKSTTNLLSVERPDWPKVYHIFKARGANTMWRQFQVDICDIITFSSPFIHNVVTHTDNRRVIKANMSHRCGNWFWWHWKNSTPFQQINTSARHVLLRNIKKFILD